MYIINPALEITDNQNEFYKIESTCAEIDEVSGIIKLYPNCSYAEKFINGKRQLHYTVSRIPCTIYRDLKKIRITRGSSVSWKFVKFK